MVVNSNIIVEVDINNTHLDINTNSNIHIDIIIINNMEDILLDNMELFSFSFSHNWQPRMKMVFIRTQQLTL